MGKTLRRMFNWFSALFHRCPENPREKRDNPFLVIGHRGSPCDEVENTIPSFEAAITREGANALELDLCMTEDGEIILWHDWDPDDPICRIRRAGMEPDVKCCPCFPEQERPVSAWNCRDFIEQHGYQMKGNRIPDARIPKLDEFMSWASGRPEILTVFFDIKIPEAEARLAPKMLDKIESIISNYQYSFTIIYELAYKKVLQAMKRHHSHERYTLDIEPAHGLVLLPWRFSAVRPALRFGNSTATLMRPYMSTLAPWSTHKRIVLHDIRLRNRKRRKGHPYVNVISFTVNNPEEMRCLIGMGADGIQTNRPALLRQVAEEMGVVPRRMQTGTQFPSPVPGMAGTG